MVTSIFQSFKEGEKKSNSDGGKEEITIALAGCAVMLEVARHLDGLSDDDRTILIQTLKSSFGLTDSLTMELFRPKSNAKSRGINHMRLCHATREAHAAKTMSRSQLEERWRLTEMVNKTFSREEKLEITAFIWSLLLADSNFSKCGQQLVTMDMAYLLHIPQDEIIESKVVCVPLG